MGGRFTAAPAWRTTLLSVALSFVLTAAGLAAPGAFSNTGNLLKGRSQFTLTVLANGKVLAAGEGGSTNGSAELYDPVAGTWSATGAFGSPRFAHTATLLANGKVLVAGGWTGLSSNTYSSALLYDPGTGVWNPAGSMAVARREHTATLLANGNVLVVGGVTGASTYLGSAEIYQPGTGTWTSAGNLVTARSGHTATLLPDGRVLVAGGISSSGFTLATAEIYDPAAGTWSATGSLAARMNHTASVLPNGKVLVAGGLGSGYLNTAQLYDPSTGAWSNTGSLAAKHYLHTASVLADGKVLVVGGYNGSYIATAELYDPATGVWTTVGPLAVPRDYHSAAVLPSGAVLIAGGLATGSSLLNSAELYDGPNFSFRNGSFETNGGAGTALASGWSISGDALIDSANATDGAALLKLNGATAVGGTAVISQAFATAAGAAYKVRFDFGVTGGVDVQKLRAEVKDGNAPGGSTQLINSASGTVTGAATFASNGKQVEVQSNTAGFSSVTFTFTAMSNVSTLVFTDTSSAPANASSGLLDNVRIEAPPLGLAYSANPAAYARNVAITPNVPTVSGGAPSAYSVSPALPAGLSLDAATGVISGTPTGTAGSGSYTVTASNALGATTAVLAISVTELPVVATSAATAVALKGATLNGTVNAKNSSTTVTFSYGLTTSYGATVAATPATVTGTTTTAVAATVSGLAPHTTYHFRVVGTNVAGEADGGDMTFTTLNTAPTASNGSATGTTGDQKTITLPFAATDADGDPVALTNVTSGPGLTVNSFSGSSVTFTPAAGFAGQGALTYTVSDGFGGTASGTVLVAVSDNDAPAIGAPAGGFTPLTLTTGAGGTAALPDYAGQAAATDNVAVTSVVQSPPAGLVTAGMVHVVLTAQDAAGNSAAAAFDVTVLDGTAPVITSVPANRTLTAGADGKALLPDLRDELAADDNVGVTGKTQLPAPGAALPVGTHTVLLTVLDAAGNAATANATITVVDATPPEIGGAFSPLVLNTDASGSVALPDYTGQAISSDNVGVQAVTQSPAAGSLVGVGVTKVVLTAVDAAGNSSSTSLDVEVRLFPRITKQPAALEVRPNAQVAFAVAAEGYAPLSYQWLKNGEEIPGATGVSLNLSKVQAGDAALYSVRVSNAVGSVTSEPARLHLIAWSEADGVYQALLRHDNAANADEPAYPGRITVTLTKSGAMSGKLEYRGLTHTFSGKFTPELNFQRSIARKNQGALSLQMHLDASALKLNVTLSEALPAGGELQSTAEALAHPVRSAKDPDAQAGRYTMILPVAAFSGDGPMAAGFAVVSVSASGAMKAAGRLPDGSALSCAGLVGGDGSIPWYSALYKAAYPYAGWVAGPVTFASNSGVNAVSGAMEWAKPAQQQGALWPLGFTRVLAVQGSLYSPPRRGQRVLNVQSDSDILTFAASGGALDFNGTVHLNGANAFLVELPNPRKLALRLDKASGLVRGTFYDSAAAKTRKLEGVVLQAQGKITGFFLDGSGAGEWTLQVGP